METHALLQRIRTLHADGQGAPLVAEQVFEALQDAGDPWSLVPLSQVATACATLNKEDAGRVPPPPLAQRRQSAPAAPTTPPALSQAAPFEASTSTAASFSSDDDDDSGRLDLRAAYTAFREREMRWLYSLPSHRHAQIAGCSRSVGRNFPAQHYMHNGEVAMVLTGQKPCVLFGQFGWQGSASEPSFADAMVREARRLAPARAHPMQRRRLTCSPAAVAPPAVSSPGAACSWLLAARLPSASSASCSLTRSSSPRAFSPSPPSLLVAGDQAVAGRV